MREPPPASHDQFGVFTASQALADGWTESALRNAVRYGALVRPRRGVFALPADPGSPDGAVVKATRSAVAAVLTHRGSRVSHAAAARLLGLPVIVRKPVGCVTVEPGRGLRDASGVHLHRARLPGHHCASGVRIGLTAAARTVVDCAREHGTEVGLVVTDAALRAGKLTLAELAATIDDCASWPWIGRALPLLGAADARAESPLESVSRWRLHEFHVPPPTLQQVILDDHGGFLARVDFYWDEFGVVGEADGRGKYTSVDVAMRQIAREGGLRDTGLGVVRWGWDHTHAFGSVASRLHAAFALGTPPGPSRRWRLG